MATNDHDKESRDKKSDNEKTGKERPSILKRKLNHFLKDPLDFAFEHYIWLIFAGIAISLLISGGKAFLQPILQLFGS